MKEFTVYIEATLEITVFAETAEEAEDKGSSKAVYGDDNIVDIKSALAEEV